MTTTDRLARWLYAPRDAAGLAALRIGFGLVMLGGCVRFVASGWVETLYGQPSYFFKYPGFEWLHVGPLWSVYLLYGGIGLAALLVALGLFYRVAIVAFTVLFTWAQLLDVTNYLNHYYLVSLLAGLMCFLPLDATWSLDARRGRVARRDFLPSWMTHVLRLQVGVVYLHAGLAKLGSDWLLHGQPLGLWLAARSELPLLGWIFEVDGVPLVMSWAGFLFDTTIVGFLLWKRSRPFAYAVLLAFHGMTHLLFQIGMFPIIMPLVTTVFFDGDWPRRVLRGVRRGATAAANEARADAMAWTARRRIGAGIAVSYCAFQLLFPLRHHLVGGDVLWHERGMRYAWKVMVREKTGSITYRVRAVGSGREWQVSPMRYLEWRQAQEMAGQPDLILALGHHVARDFEDRGHGPVEVRVDALVSLNGRAPAALIDPGVDLASLESAADLAPHILPRPGTPPVTLASWTREET